MPHPLRFKLTVWGGFLACLAVPAAALAAEPAPPVDFSREVRPLLTGKCFACHGPDDKTREAELRFDDRAAAVAKKAIVPGDSRASTLLARVTSTDPDKVMPPPDSKKPPLTPAEVDVLRRWIDAGAKFDLHWAYVPPQRVPPPAVPLADWAAHPLDAYIAARWQQATPPFSPSPEADRRTLIRRLAFDLTGLPPTPEQVDAFLSDTAPDAYEKLVDRLLASPHFGERLAVVWLDLVRYADSGGYHSDNAREVWLFRDYVVNAFNANKPYDRFCLEQLAGDLLPDATNETRIASGYNRLLQTTEEGGAQAKEYTAKYAADRVRNFGVVWLGATTGCCECHNHKYDPLSTRDFYSLAAFFADVDEKAVGRQQQTPIHSPEQEKQLQALVAQIAAGKSQLEREQQSPEFAAAFQAWLGQVAPAAEWTPLKPAQAEATGGAKLQVQDDASVLASGESPETSIYTLTFPVSQSNVTALRLEVLPDKSLPQQGCGRAGNGNFVVTELVAKFQASATAAAEPVAFAAASASFEQKVAGEKNPYGAWTAAAAIDGDRQGSSWGWATLEEIKQPNQAVFQVQGSLAGGEGAVLTLNIEQKHGAGRHTLGRFRVSVTSATPPVAAVGAGLPRDVRDVLALPAAQRKPPQTRQLQEYYQAQAPAAAELRKQLAAAEQAKAELLKQAPSTLVSMAANPRTVRLLPRGNWLDDSGEIMAPAVPSFLGQLEVKDRRPTRLDLARWVVAPENPLFARVFVNRLWKVMFGQGLVRSLEDFGLQGVTPSHPELLDYLALEFRASGYNVKSLLKFMALSRTYRQSSAAPPALASRDPTNAFLARQNRFRLDAEFVRDNSLAVSGLLVPTVGGPTAKPYQPRGYWSWLNFPTREWENDKGPNQYRRGLYTFWQRTFLHPSLVAFDAPSREECVAERPRSNTPLQALTLLNDPTYVEAARALAAAALTQGGADDATRLQFLYRRVLQRAPQQAEIDILKTLVEKHRTQYAANSAEAAALAAVGDFRAPEGIAAAELAAWTNAARALLNLHETVVRN